MDSSPLHRKMGEMMFAVLKPWHTEGKRRVKEKKRRERPKKSKEEKVNLKDAVFEVLSEAVRHVSGNGSLPYAARRLLYRVRKLIQRYTDAELKEGYFRDRLLQDYQREHGKLEGLYYEPRGQLHEPHGGRTIDVGTREVEAYEFPPHLFNKLLYVEKRGQFPLLKSARFMERYDMAIMTGQGVATTAARTLLENADKTQKIQLFVLHDADPYGYNIAHTVREETERMPEYSVDVIDIGLTIEQGLALGIEPEDFVRKEALYRRVLKHLDAESPAWQMFGADRAEDRHVPCKRIELDALTAPEAVRLIDDALSDEGVLGKVIPPPDELPGLARQIFRKQHAGWVLDALEELVDLPELQRELAERFMPGFRLENTERYVKARIKQDETFSWRNALVEVFGQIQDAKHAEALKEAVRVAVLEKLLRERGPEA